MPRQGECRGEACLARHVRRTRIADIAIIHFKTSFVGYRERGMPRPYKALPPQGYRHNFATLTGRAAVRAQTGQAARSG